MKIFPVVHFRRITIAAFLGIMGLATVVVVGCSEKKAPSFLQGQEIFKADCLACHGANGGGVLYPKTVLVNSALVTGDPNKVIAVILFGREGEGVMPGWYMNLSDQEVAAVATYIRQDWSNRAGPITPAMVAEFRAKGKKAAGK